MTGKMSGFAHCTFFSSVNNTFNIMPLTQSFNVPLQFPYRKSVQNFSLLKLL
jgi:hypothetical protein